MSDTHVARKKRLRIKRPRIAIAGLGLITLGVLLRLYLLAAGWPTSNSDEGTMGLEALHILRLGEHPIYLYGQHYMGVGEAYLGAALFSVFGVSLFALRLGMLLLYGVFMLAMGVLTRLLYGWRVTIVTLALLALGSADIIQPELMAVGGAAETLACGSILFVLATWLAITVGASARTDGAARRGPASWPTPPGV